MYSPYQQEIKILDLSVGEILKPLYPLSWVALTLRTIGDSPL